MTSGHHRADRELRRLQAANPQVFHCVGEPHLHNGFLQVTIGLFLGPLELRDGGLDFREYEEFEIWVPGDFPFAPPHITVSHSRFAGFPHVTWNRYLCLYQSRIEWNPSDGLYGFFDRLKHWIAQSATNEMDPVDGPLEPPHHLTDTTQKPFVIRANAPCASGDSWTGLAILHKHPNRTELVGWDDLSGAWPADGKPAFAVILPQPLPMEFPASGAALLREVSKAGVPRERMIANLAIAALLSTDGEPLHLVLGLPMRRAADGSPRLHVAVWTASAEITKSLRAIVPKDADTEVIRGLRDDLKQALLNVLNNSQIAWCPILEDRDEIVVRRDHGTSLAWCAGKKVMVLGCGALGSWAAEMVARAKPQKLCLVDNSIVKPGILTRQNFTLEDIGDSKAAALARRIALIQSFCEVITHVGEAHDFLQANVQQLGEYDLILDCTASSVFQMKLERDWHSLSQHLPPLASLVIDAQSRHCLCVIVPKDSTGGPWDAYLNLKRILCVGGYKVLVEAFYAQRAVQQLFQPEPGCSDPTFVGSAADVTGLVSAALNKACGCLVRGQESVGLAITAPTCDGSDSIVVVEIPRFREVLAGNYRIRLARNVFTQARALVQQSNRRRSADCETGGLLWGFWDDAVQVIWVLDLSGPSPDSKHSPGHFVCGIEGGLEESRLRSERTHGVCQFIGHWHTHPDLSSQQSETDMLSMAALVASIGQNQKKSMMLIFGRTNGVPSAGVYVYESESVGNPLEMISVGMAQLELEIAVV